MTTDRKQSIHQSLNTVLMTLITIFLTFIFSYLKSISEKTDSLMIKVNVHENQIENMKAEIQDQKSTKQWVEDNFQRKYINQNRR